MNHRDPLSLNRSGAALIASVHRLAPLMRSLSAASPPSLAECCPRRSEYPKRAPVKTQSAQTSLSDKACAHSPAIPTNPGPSLPWPSCLKPNPSSTPLSDGFLLPCSASGTAVAGGARGRRRATTCASTWRSTSRRLSSAARRSPLSLTEEVVKLSVQKGGARACGDFACCALRGAIADSYDTRALFTSSLYVRHVGREHLVFII